MSQVNGVLDYLGLEIRTIDQTITKIKNTFEHKYNFQYG